MKAQVARPLLAAVLPLLCLLLLVAGCGEDDPAPASEQTPTSPEDEVRAFAEDYLAAVRTGDGESVCASLTRRLRIERRADFRDAGGCIAWAEGLGDRYADDPEAWEQELGGEIRGVAVDDGRAVFFVGEKGDGSAILLVRMGGAWLVDGNERERAYRSSLTS